MIARDEIVFDFASGPHSFRCPTRDFHILYHLQEGQMLIETIGLAERLSVMKGVPPGEVETCSRFLVLSAAEAALLAVKRDADLLGYNYTVDFDPMPNPDSGPILIDGFTCDIDTKPSGFCTMQLSQPGANGRPRIVETRDLRIHRRVQTDGPVLLKVVRRKAKLTLGDELSKLVKALGEDSSREITIRLS